ncbi:glycosyltransferase family 2 protein [Sphingobium sp. DEHP117]|uniref:glycosyltransferase family 2 protein n=1 Tax=Sphingobium sp. DEHP117 TaxID=2993436 RepID=UPI0027D5ED71|nr:glycosyltransferase [Sphingobium sp. DEHP117]MDQ4421049.1 glycosyltransferase family 2 protein [Sphingobium sp. DEHP117]
MRTVDPATASGTGALSAAPAVSVVIPAYNEENAVIPTIEKVREVLNDAGIPFELVVVNDGSKDGTAAAAKSTGVHVVDFPHNGGYGRALKAGIAVTKAPLVAIIDADGTYPAEMLPQMIEMAAYNQMVVGDRGAAMKGVPMIRKPAKWVLNNLASYLAGHKITDLNSGLRVFQRPELERFIHLLPNAFSFTTTITLCMLASGFNVSYLPITYGKRVGTSKIKAVDFFRFMMLVFRLTVYFQPLRIFMPLGAFLFLIGVGKAVYDVWIDNLSETAIFGMLGAIVIWSFGLIADMMARMQLRPPGTR